jgi:hypothetical protein
MGVFLLIFLRRILAAVTLRCEPGAVGRASKGDGSCKRHHPSRAAFGRHLRMTARREAYLIACGLIGDPVPPLMMSGAPQKKNS